MTSLTEVRSTSRRSKLPWLCRFLLAVPAGTIGDIVDRRKLILITEVWMCQLPLAGDRDTRRCDDTLASAYTYARSFGGRCCGSSGVAATFPDLVNKKSCLRLSC